VITLENTMHDNANNKSPEIIIKHNTCTTIYNLLIGNKLSQKMTDRK